MVLARWEHPVQDSAGSVNVMTDVWVEVRREDVAGNPLAAIYSDRHGTTNPGNPFLSTDGIPAFHAIGGSYQVRLYKTGYDKTWRYQAIGTGAEADTDELLIPGYLFEFETGTTAPPAAGSIRANNATLTSATRLYVWKSTIAGVDISSRIAALVGKRVLLTSTNAGELVGYQVDLVTDQSTYYELVVSAPVGAASFPAGRVGLQTDGAEGQQGLDGLFSGAEVTLTNASETLISAYNGKTVLLNRSSAMTLGASAAATLGTWAVIAKNISTGVVTIDPNGAELIDGVASVTLSPNESCIIACNGTALRTLMRGYTSGGADVSLADGGTGSSLADPNADRIMFWDDSAGFVDWLAMTGLAISGTTLALDPATQAEQEAGSITTKAVTPGRQQFHPSAAKAWGMTSGGGTPVLSASYNITSVSDDATGKLGVVIATDFSSATYAILATALLTTSQDRFVSASSIAAGTFQLSCFSGTTASDPSLGYAFTCYGDQ